MELKLIMAIVAAAEREGGISKLQLCGRKRKFRSSVSCGFLWYNVESGTTHVIKIQSTKKVTK